MPTNFSRGARVLIISNHKLWTNLMRYPRRRPWWKGSIITSKTAIGSSRSSICSAGANVVAVGAGIARTESQRAVGQ